MIKISIWCSSREISSMIQQVIIHFPQTYLVNFQSCPKDFIQQVRFSCSPINILCLDKQPNYSEFYKIARNPVIQSSHTILIEDGVPRHIIGKLSSCLAVIEKKNVENKLTRLLQILNRNRNVLTTNNFLPLLNKEYSGMFILNNDLFEVTVYTRMLILFLKNQGFLKKRETRGFEKVLNELLLNAIEYGNCRVSWDEKEFYCSQGISRKETIERLQNKNEIARRKVFISYETTPGRASIKIRDEGGGFDWKYWFHSLDEDLPGSRKKLGVKKYMNNLDYNAQGNEVSFSINASPKNLYDKDFNRNTKNKFKRVTAKKGEVILNQGEYSDTVFYIYSGSYKILINQVHSATLTPEDLFLGEMSFLLDSTRTATIIADEPGILYQMERSDFYDLIDRCPEYGLALSQVLATRLRDLHLYLVEHNIPDELTRVT